MDVKLQSQIFLAFFRVGMLGYGGGPAAIPLVQKEVVELYEWMDDEEFGDLLALSNTLPGPVLTKLSGYIGYRVGGFFGMLGALFASVIPTVVLMIILIGFLTSFSDSPIVQGMTHAIAPVVGVMMLVLTYNFLKTSRNQMGWTGMLALTGLAILITEIADVHPAILIGILLIIGFSSIRHRKQEAGQT
ncbi:chromate transporter [Salsuginibacillus halophilus]|uniref:Chromate transporter n=1 Tax=Salsuginibacillus halophilus TaxID=517424 RepID=A0A2P8HQQ6_9BACI|nr:chromate transporter [Salsuginibacillus halophilus]PSL48514.1 chromate transporter [Salsuginibacillus halophilus]